MTDTLFFIISTLAWILVSPGNFIVLLGVGAWLSLMAGWQKVSRRLLSVCSLLLLSIGFLPVGEWLIAPLENRFMVKAAPPVDADGVIVLGGAISPLLSHLWNQVELVSGAERVTDFIYLARLYPEAQLVFTGGSGELMQQEHREAEYARDLFNRFGVTDRPILFESDSRNTFENARNSKQLVSPDSGENWILVTSAFHMPRAVGVFCGQGWPVTPWPVDHKSRKGDLLRFDFNFSRNVSTLRTAVREWVGLLAYRFTGRSSHFLPGDGNHCGARQALVG
jgi:uncharacterized SAM-binding protein YcdF (DUF218 family)